MIRSRSSTLSSPGTCAPCPSGHRSKPKKIAARWHVWNRLVARTRRPHRQQRSHPTPPRPLGTFAPHCRPIPPQLQNRFPKNRPSHPRPPPPHRAGQVVKLTKHGQTSFSARVSKTFEVRNGSSIEDPSINQVGFRGARRGWVDRYMKWHTKEILCLPSLPFV